MAAAIKPSQYSAPDRDAIVLIRLALAAAAQCTAAMAICSGTGTGALASHCEARRTAPCHWAARLRCLSCMSMLYEDEILWYCVQTLASWLHSMNSRHWHTVAQPETWKNSAIVFQLRLCKLSTESLNLISTPLHANDYLSQTPIRGKPFSPVHGPCTSCVLPRAQEHALAAVSLPDQHRMNIACSSSCSHLYL